MRAGSVTRLSTPARRALNLCLLPIRNPATLEIHELMVTRMGTSILFNEHHGKFAVDGHVILKIHAYETARSFVTCETARPAQPAHQ
jgi:hypothetical protein